MDDVDDEEMTPTQLHVRELLQQSNERLIQEHLRELKKRINASIAALPADLQQYNVWRRVRFDGGHMEPKWSADPGEYFWLEPVARGSCCFFRDGIVVDCSERLPPLGWSRWIYYCSKLPASKFFRVEFDIEKGEMMYAFRLWGRQSLMSCSGATEAIEESRTGSKQEADRGRTRRQPTPALCALESGSVRS